MSIISDHVVIMFLSRVVFWGWKNLWFVRYLWLIFPVSSMTRWFPWKVLRFQIHSDLTFNPLWVYQRLTKAKAEDSFDTEFSIIFVAKATIIKWDEGVWECWQYEIELTGVFPAIRRHATSRVNLLGFSILYTSQILSFIWVS